MDTLIATSAELAGDRSVIACAEAVRPAVDAASNEIETTRRLPQALLDRLHEAQLFRLLLPRSSNGIETDPVTFFHVIEAIVTQQLQGQLRHFETVGAWMMGADADLTFV